MKALILAAGKGTRLLPLTEHCPKPLLKIKNTTLIENQINKLVAAGIKRIVITLHYLGDQIEQAIGDGDRWNIKIDYSWENKLLNTGGGVYHALSLLGNRTFLVVNSDIWTDYPYQDLLNTAPHANGHLILVDNPVGKKGDFSLTANNEIRLPHDEEPKFTFSGISLLHPVLFERYKLENFSLLSVFKQTIADHQLCGDYYPGMWMDAGSLENYAKLQRLYN